MVKQKDIPSPAKKRELILQALYQKEISGVSNTEVLKQLKERNKKYDLSDLNLILKGIKQNKQTIDKMIEQNSKLELKDIGEIELLNRLKKFMRKGQIEDDVAEITL